jgi:phospholipase/carboxylesterase
MSGFIPTVEGWSADLDRPGLPVWIAHGRRDPVIGIEFGETARDALTAGGADVTYREHEGAHHVDPRALAELPAWVERAIEAAPATAS